LYSREKSRWPAPHIDEEAKNHFSELGLLPTVTYPSNNPYSGAKADLGKKLFFDPRLSGSRQISCASCHDPDLAFADGRTVSFGHGRTELKRNAPSVVNTAFNEVLFWDGRAMSLEQQAADVVLNAEEMHATAKVVRERLSKIQQYTNDFLAAFGDPEVTLTRVAQAIATFERTLTSRGNAFDSFLRGKTNALSDAAIRGLHLFRTTARCLNCHNGPNFTDGRFHNEGLTYYGRKYEDLGRYGVTKDPKDVGRFKTPSLRNVTRTAPYMHNGLFDLDGVLNMYNAGMPTSLRRPDQRSDPLFPEKSPLLKPLGLNKQDLADLKEFLGALTETRVRMRPPSGPYSANESE
jgi:cytochrome c peroxidase